MADAVTTTTLFEGQQRLVVRLTNRSDGTGESNVTKVDKSTFTGLNGLEPTSLVVEGIAGDSSGMQVRLYCDRTTPVEIATLGGVGIYKRDYRSIGGLSTAGSGGTGDILLSTTGHSAGDSYDITLYLRKKD